jgi:hypothetical protein
MRKPTINLTQDSPFPGSEPEMDMRFGTWNVRDLREIGWTGMDWIDLAQDRDHWRALMDTALNLQVPQNVGKFLSN